MKIILCLDDNNGMLFNNRRQSRDSVVIEDVLNNLNGEKLNIFPFSSSLFSSLGDKINQVESIGRSGAYFVENVDVTPIIREIDELIVYRWNRVYPADFSCEIDFSAFIIKCQTEFVGSSHDKITKVVYGR